MVGASREVLQVKPVIVDFEFDGMRHDIALIQLWHRTTARDPIPLADLGEAVQATNGFAQCFSSAWVSMASSRTACTRRERRAFHRSLLDGRKDEIFGTAEHRDPSEQRPVEGDLRGAVLMQRVGTGSWSAP